MNFYKLNPRYLYRRFKFFKKWINIIWDHHNIDYAEIYDLLYYKLLFMVETFEKSKRWRYVGIEKDIDKMKTCIFLLERIRKDDYEMDLKSKDPYYLRKQDIDYLHKILNKHMDKWWI